jgi:hypothetical protein
MRKLIGCLLMVAGFVFFSGAAVWADEGTSQTERWQMTIEPYAWLPQITGPVPVHNTKSKVKLDVSDYGYFLDELVMLLSGRLTMQKGSFAIFYDGMYLEMQDEINGAVSSKVDYYQLIQELGISYKVADWAVGGENKKNLNVEALGGVRHVYFRTKGNATDPLGLQLEADKTREWADPFIGARTTLGLTDQTSVSLRGDVGGFGVSSDFIWNTVCEMKHLLTKNKNWFTTMSYRAMNTDYHDGDFAYEVDFYGPMASVGVTF